MDSLHEGLTSPTLVSASVALKAVVVNVCILFLIGCSYFSLFLSTFHGMFEYPLKIATISISCHC